MKIEDLTEGQTITPQEYAEINLSIRFMYSVFINKPNEKNKSTVMVQKKYTESGEEIKAAPVITFYVQY